MKLWAAAAVAACLWSGEAFAQQATQDPPPPSFWSRVTVEVPVYTHHIPNDWAFNDQNWGGFVDVALTRDWSLVAGDFRNSYRRNTAFAGASWEPLKVKVSGLRLAFGGMAGFDLNGGYRGYNSVEPLLGALNVRLDAADPHGPLQRFGLLLTVIPPAASHGSTAMNLALTYRLR